MLHGVGQVHIIVHRVSDLALADEAQRDVVDLDQHKGDPVLDCHRDLLHGELEGAVAHHPNDQLLRSTQFRPNAGRDFPAEGTHLPADEVVTGLVAVLELTRPDLVEANSGHEDGVTIETLVDLLEDPGWFDGDLVKIHPPLEQPTYFCDSCCPVGRWPWPLPARLAQQRLQSDLRIGDDAQIRFKHPTELPWLDVDLNELALPPIHLQIAGMSFGKACSH